MKTNKTKFKAARWALCMPLAVLLVASGCMVGPSIKPIGAAVEISMKG